MIEPALVLALGVAKATEHPDDVPRVLRPVLGFAKWNARAFDIARRALDADPAFRARVAEAVADDEPDLHPSWLFLHRPDGWEEELAALADAATTRAAQEELEREERVAVQRLRGVEEAREKAEQARRDAEAATRTAEEKLTAERRARQAANADAKAARDELADLRSALAAAEREAVRAREAGERSSAAAGELKARVTQLEAELAKAHRQVRDADERSGEPRATPPRSDDAGAQRVSADPAVARAIAEAAEGARRLAEALASAAAAMIPGPSVAARPAPSEVDQKPERATDAVALARSKGERSTRAVPPARRRPTALPPATFEESPEAAEHLVRVRGALLLVDGYNAAFATRPGASVADRRARIIDALGELSARTGITVHAIFDGADDAVPMGAQRSPEGVRVSFTRGDVEADDVILELVDDTPVDRPVIVATSDRRVQSGARQRGANVITTAQLYGVLRRER